jgi:molecular chaperone DnaK
LTDSKSVLSGTPNAAELNASREKLTASSHKLAEAMYKAAAAQAPADAGATGTTDEAPKAQDEGVIDAEYVDVDKK